MSRYIKADALIKFINNRFDITWEHDYEGGIKDACMDILEEINKQPTADVVEVVRCKDCKFRKIEFGWNGKRYKMCANTDYPTDDDAYCSFGERREE